MKVLLLVVAMLASASSAQAAVRLAVTPNTALIDAPVVIRATGLRAGSQVGLSATTIDAKGLSWRSEAQFRADSKGVVDTRTSRSLKGSYVGRDRQGLFWSMLRVRREGPGDDGRGFFSPPQRATAVTVGVRQRGRLLATARLLRSGLTDRVKKAETALGGEGFAGVYDAPPPASVRRPAVLILGGSEGGNSGTFGAGLLASHGYPALSLAYFKAPGLPSELRNIPLEYFQTALRWLSARPGVDPDKVMILGASRGGEAALLIASTYPTLVHGVIAYVPSAYVGGSCCSSFTHPAWTLGGKPIPFGLNSPIAVEKIDGPILAIGAALDGAWPSYIAVPTIVQRAKEHGKNDVTGIVYKGAGHAVGIGIPNIPSRLTTTIGGRTVAFGGSVAADARGRADSWPRVLALLKNATQPS